MGQLARFRGHSVPNTAKFEADVCQAAQEFGNTTFVYRKRDFHNYFMVLTTQDSVAQLFVLLYIIAAFHVGCDVIDGNINISSFTTFTAAFIALKSSSEKLIAMLIGFPQGEASIRRIAEVINLDPSLGEDSASEEASTSEDDERSLV